MKKMIYIMLCLILILMIFQSKKYFETEPDVVNSIKFNQDETLTVVANRNFIVNKKEFAMTLVAMRLNNSFKSMKFSDDYGYIQNLTMNVYFGEVEINEGQPFMIVEYRPIDETSDYNMIDNPEMYELYVNVIY